MRLESVLLIAMLLAVSGCSDSESPQQPLNGNGQGAATGHESSTDPVVPSQRPSVSFSAVTITKPANLQETAELIAGQTGKVVVVDLWALW